MWVQLIDAGIEEPRESFSGGLGGLWLIQVGVVSF